MAHGSLTVTLDIHGPRDIYKKFTLLIAKHFLRHYCVCSNLRAANCNQQAQAQKRKKLVSRFASSSPVTTL